MISLLSARELLVIWDDAGMGVRSGAILLRGCSLLPLGIALPTASHQLMRLKVIRTRVKLRHHLWWRLAIRVLKDGPEVTSA